MHPTTDHTCKKPPLSQAWPAPTDDCAKVAPPRNHATLPWERILCAIKRFLAIQPLRQLIVLAGLAAA